MTRSEPDVRLVSALDTKALGRCGVALLFLVTSSLQAAEVRAHEAPEDRRDVGIVRAEIHGEKQLRISLAFLNEGTSPRPLDAPRRMPATLSSGVTKVAIELVAVQLPDAILAPGAFLMVAYQATLPAPAADVQGLQLSVAGVPPVLIGSMPSEAQPTGLPTPGPQSLAIATPTTEAPIAEAGNAFLDRLSAFEPNYAAFGTGTDSNGKIQLSFRYQLFGQRKTQVEPQLALDQIHFAYTQRMYWDTAADSAPFRNIDFMPELHYRGERRLRWATLAAQVGLQHQSNGQEGADSRSLNVLYIQPSINWPIEGWDLTLAPRGWIYVGSLSENPDIERYRGHTGLNVELGQERGLRLSLASRLDFESGRGAAELHASYPIDKLVGGDLNLYLFGQAFTGYGENLLDYRRDMTRARIGLAITR